MPKLIPIEAARRQLHYDPKTGQIMRLAASPTGRAPAGLVYTSRYENAYIRVSIDGESFSAHRVAWALMTGKQPNVIDHINGQRHDNRWENLRDVSASENARNQAMHRPGSATRKAHRAQCKPE